MDKIHLYSRALINDMNGLLFTLLMNGKIDRVERFRSSSRLMRYIWTEHMLFL